MQFVELVHILPLLSHAQVEAVPQHISEVYIYNNYIKIEKQALKKAEIHDSDLSNVPAAVAAVPHEALDASPMFA